MHKIQIRKHFRFEAAHALPHHQGKCARMHGHSYRLEVALLGDLQLTGAEAGMVADFAELAAIVKAEVIDFLDHTTLNDCIENPTAERTLLWIWERLATHFENLDELVLWETPDACAVLRAERLP